MSTDEQVLSAQDAASRAIRDACRWQFCIQHGFPVRNQHPSVPERGLFAWMAYGPGNVRGQGHTAVDAVDDVMLKTFQARVAGTVA